MEQLNQLDIQSFLYRRRGYYGQFSPEALVFNANLQEFSQRVSYICNLQTGGKLSAPDSYHQINALWEQLKRSYEALAIGKDAEDVTRQDWGLQVAAPEKIIYCLNALDQLSVKPNRSRIKA